MGNIGVGRFSHTLTEAQMPSHSHEGFNKVAAGTNNSYKGPGFSSNFITYLNTVGDGQNEYILFHEGGGHTSGSGYQVKDFKQSDGQKVMLDGELVIETKGSDQSHNNIPPGYALWVFERTA
jgi:microcystin-dependent protein